MKVCWIKPFISGFGPNPIEHRAKTGRLHCVLQPYSCAFACYSLAIGSDALLIIFMLVFLTGGVSSKRVCAYTLRSTSCIVPYMHLCTVYCHKWIIIKLLNKFVIPFGFRRGITLVALVTRTELYLVFWSIYSIQGTERVGYQAWQEC